MSFELKAVHGTVEELGSDLAAPPLHEREEFVVEEVKKAIYHVVSALGGYLSVSCSGNINPVAGETGDVVQIYITSLPRPDSAPVETPIATAPGIETGEPTPVTEESPQPQPVISLENVEPVQPNPSNEIPVEASGEFNESTTAPVQQEVAPDGPTETAPAITESPAAPFPTVPAVNESGITPVIPPAAQAPVETNTTSIGQAEAQEIAQATPPVES